MQGWQLPVQWLRFYEQCKKKGKLDYTNKKLDSTDKKLDSTKRKLDPTDNH